MESFLKFFNDITDNYGFNLEIYYSSITDWCIKVGYKSTHPKSDETVINVSHCDIEFVFAKAQVELKEWLLEHEGGY